MTFEYTATVRFHAVDRAGIMFFSRVFEYCHDAFEDALMAAIGRERLRAWQTGWGMPLVHAESDYRAPMRHGDRLVIGVEVERLGERSITFGYDVRGEEGSPRARVRLVHAFIDSKTFQPRSAPDELVDGLRRLGLLPE